MADVPAAIVKFEDGKVGLETETIASTERKNDSEKVSVLLVDDSPEKILALESILSRNSFDIVKAASGMDALRLLLRHDFALILLDVNMPVMDGYETATLIRSRKRSEHTPIIFLTAYNSGEFEMARGYSLGAVDFIFAPVVPAILAAKVNIFVDLYRMNHRLNLQAAALKVHTINLLSANRSLERITQELRQEVEVRKHTEADLMNSRIQLNRSNEILDAKVRDRTEELERLNHSLLMEVRERTTAEQDLKVSLEEKQALLKEIHHRVKNNLQIISSLLRLQSGRISDSRAAGLLLDSQNRIKSMALVHERLYGNADLGRIGFAGYLMDLARQLFQSFGAEERRIELLTELQDIPLSVDLALPCGLIIHELISNALKHAFPAGRFSEIGRKAQVTLGCSRLDNGDIELRVSDNGVGLSPDLEAQSIRTLGMQLVNTLVRQVKGDLQVERNGGSAFRIRIAMERETEREGERRTHAQSTHHGR